MKNIFFVSLIFLALSSFFSCNKCESIIPEPCGEIKPNSEFCNMTVSTFYTEDPSGYIGSIYDTRLNSTATPGDDWGQTLIPNQPANWTAGRIGQVFGTTIDDVGNIYLASSDIYFLGGGFPSTNITRPGGPTAAGRIFKCQPGTGWMAAQLIDLINTGDPLNGIGNIAFDKKNKQLFATNLEDGMIYRISTSGSLLETYDPWAADVSGAGIVAQEERVWGIGVNVENGQVKVYFPRVATTAPTERSIYSITLAGDAFPTAGSEVIEIANVPGSQPIISDLAFSTNGNELLIAERGAPHQAKVLSYTRNGNSWNSNLTYFVGGFSGENSAGGVDFAYTESDGNVSAGCDEFFWATGNYLHARNLPNTNDRVYGLEGIDYAGNRPWSDPVGTANQDTDLFIDYDQQYTWGAKSSIGDVEVFDCTACEDPCELDDLH